MSKKPKPNYPAAENNNADKKSIPYPKRTTGPKPAGNFKSPRPPRPTDRPFDGAPKGKKAPELAPEPVVVMTTFAELNLSEPVARAIADLGFEAPTPIQARSIPLLLAGRDLIMRAYAEKDGLRIGFGEVRGEVLPAS